MSEKKEEKTVGSSAGVNVVGRGVDFSRPRRLDMIEYSDLDVVASST